MFYQLVVLAVAAVAAAVVGAVAAAAAATVVAAAAYGRRLPRRGTDRLERLIRPSPPAPSPLDHEDPSFPAERSRSPIPFPAGVLEVSSSPPQHAPTLPPRFWLSQRLKQRLHCCCCFA